MVGPTRILEIRTSPHLLSGHRVETIMFNVVLALLPTTAWAIWCFGLKALLVLVTALASCLLTERAACAFSDRPSSLGDGSVAITGLLYGLTLPPGLPLWMVAVGGVIGVAMGKALFGGLGANPFNPALVARAFLQAAFPVAMTSWLPPFGPDRFGSLPASTLAPPFSRAVVDGWSGATPLAASKFGGELSALADLATGAVAGSLGETSGLLILLGGAWLVARHMMNWRIPVGIFTVVAGASALLHFVAPESHAPPGFMLFSGGLMLGAVFMATDMVGSPVTGAGCLLYGALIGALVVVIRAWGGMPEGVMYAILLANAVSPHIDRWIRPRVFGQVAAEGDG
ncbi:MAG: RnfABCDGE type electron transport complex subunit D [bacterium]|nr:RnfABCDGE type electron transport complex subunit D [bacterium]MCP5065710.1 RnfABCDGE type electron transport complex subunit D [bacterium]